jgi:hypothetical protein
MREREIHTVLDGGEGEASWEEEKKKAQDRPIRLTAALRHLASVPSPPPQPPTIAPSRSPPNSAAYSTIISLFLARSCFLSLSWSVEVQTLPPRPTLPCGLCTWGTRWAKVPMGSPSLSCRGRWRRGEVRGSRVGNCNVALAILLFIWANLQMKNNW